MTVGIPLPRGLQQVTDDWCIEQRPGETLPLQVRVLERWSDGSIRWALLDFRADVAEELTAASLRFTGGDGTLHPSSVSASGGTNRLVMAAAGRVFSFVPQPGTMFEVHAEGADSSPSLFLLAIRGRDGQPLPIQWNSATVEEDGIVRACVRLEGHAAVAEKRRLDLVARVHVYQEVAAARLVLTIRNPHRAVHPNGFWELGDAGSTFIRDASLLIKGSASATGGAATVEEQHVPQTWVSRFHLYQDSSGGENWRSRNHVNRNGEVPLLFRGFRAAFDDVRHEGLRATPIAWTGSGQRMTAVAVPEFWQNFPRALEASAEGLRVGFWPTESADLHELQGGEQKTHECWVSFGPDPITEVPLAWCRRRVVPHCSPEWYALAEAVPYLVPASCDPHEQYKALVSAAVEGDDTFLSKREVIDEYGWRHFGDIYGDHEALFPVTQVDGPLVSHCNNQYDPVGGCASQFMRTGDVRWWRLGDELARHVVDIDIYHTDEDKAAYNHGLFWHTVHYVDAGKATHRTYPKAKGSNGGGPASEQNYPTGLRLRYLMTGDAAAREAAIELAQFVIDMDDGRKTVFKYLDRGFTGLASASRSPCYHGPGRGSGNSLNALLEGHRLTGEQRFLDKAEQLIRRCVHPRQNIEALGLLDAENRWFYTLFLQSLAGYLQYKVELGQVDGMYAYGREVLLHYARWMAAHEYPILQKPEILEYPTETWAAQDMRKCEILQVAVRHAADGERGLFEERAAFFFDYVTRSLSAMETKTLARPVVLLLSHGFSRAWFVLRKDSATPLPAPLPADFGDHAPFVPQKARAMACAKRLAAVAGLGLLAAGVGLLSLLWG